MHTCAHIFLCHNFFKPKLYSKLLFPNAPDSGLLPTTTKLRITERQYKSPLTWAEDALTTGPLILSMSLPHTEKYFSVWLATLAHP